MLINKQSFQNFMENVQEYLYPADTKMYNIGEKLITLLEASIITEKFLTLTLGNGYWQYNAGQYDAFKLMYRILANTLCINEDELSGRINERKFLGMYGSLDDILGEQPDLSGSVKTCTMLVSSENGITLMSKGKEE